LKQLKGRLRAKTGTIRYVNTLSGYLTTKANEELAFSIMLNAYSSPGGAHNKDEVDAIPALVAELADCTCKAEE
jgi:D-alanyl-D-alanine carboxypeptidase/D-alanyl-D-alanine-endopeptidase (penicillin-binding protein 4)